MLVVTLIFAIGCGGTAKSINSPEVKFHDGRTAFINADTALYTKPNGKVIRNDLIRGKVVTIISNKGSWVEILLYTYDTPTDNKGWVKADVLSYSTKGFVPVEARMKQDQSLFGGPGPNGKVLPDKVGPHNQVYIIKRENGWIHGQFAGGLDGWITEDSIEYVGPVID